jgi:hypothetical protein
MLSHNLFQLCSTEEQAILPPLRTQFLIWNYYRFKFSYNLQIRRGLTARVTNGSIQNLIYLELIG